MKFGMLDLEHYKKNYPITWIFIMFMLLVIIAYNTVLIPVLAFLLLVSLPAYLYEKRKNRKKNENR